MVKKAIIILAKGFEEIEAIAVIDIVRRANIDLTIAGVGGKKVSSARNLNITADKTVNEINADDYDALIIPGGAIGAKNLANSKKTAKLIKKMFTDGKIVAAICAAPAVVLAPIGIMDDKTVTCYPDMHSELGKTVKFKNEKVVVDENLITSQGPATAMEFAFTIAEKLAGKKIAEKLRKATLAG